MSPISAVGMLRNRMNRAISLIVRWRVKIVRWRVKIARWRVRRESLLRGANGTRSWGVWAPG
jgi:hypothetical protein